MTNELHLTRRLRHTALAIGLALAGAGAYAQNVPPPPSGVSYPAPSQDTASAQDAGGAVSAPLPARHSRGEVRPYLEVSQVLSADLGSGGNTLTYTSVAAGVDGRIETHRVSAQASLRYERDIDWNGRVASRDQVSGIASVHAEVAPGLLSLDAGGLATRTGGEGRTFGVTNRQGSIDVYSVYAGPTLSTHAGPLAINGAYRFGYTKVDDNTPNGRLNQDFDSSTAHSLTGSIGMAPGRLPFGWTVGGGYAHETSGGRFDNRFDGRYVRGDVVVPVGPTLALTAGVGYEDIESSQRDVVRDAGGVPVADANGRLTPNPTAPRLLTYDLSGMMYDGGVLWRPSPRTEVQARAGHRYGGTTVVGSIAHRFNEHAAINAAVYDTVETFGHQLTTDISGLPVNLNANRDPLMGSLGGCVFGGTGGGVCLDRSLQSITGSTFRARGASLVYSGGRGLWSYGLGANYNHRRYFRPTAPGVTVQGARSDQDASVYGTLGRRLSRTSEVNFQVYASWFDNDQPGFDAVTSEGATIGYSRTFMLEHLQLLAALGIYHNESGGTGTTNASALAGLRYSF